MTNDHVTTVTRGMVDFIDYEQTEPRQRTTAVSSGITYGRETAVHRALNQRKNEFTNLQPCRVLCVTWNVNGQLPTEDLTTLLSVDERPADVICVGYQELDLSPETLLLLNDSSKEQMWMEKMKAGLPKGVSYKLLKHIRLVGILLVVYVRESIMSRVSDVSTGSVSTGILGMLGNKGGVSIKLNIDMTSIAIVNSHLAAHQEMVERRNQDYRDIFTKMRFDNDEANTLKNSDIVVWVGDLNYRVSEDEISGEEIRKFAEKWEIGQLLRFDQLREQRNKHLVFEEFVEDTINFMPTYKYNPGTDKFDTSEKCRTPAWCDRILWKSNTMLKCEDYRSHPIHKLSDHKPVSAVLLVQTRVVDVQKKQLVLDEILKDLDRIANDSLPQAALNRTELMFDGVKYLEAQEQPITLQNTGTDLFEFEFIPKLEDRSICAPWLHIEPQKGIVDPGNVMIINFTVYIDNKAMKTIGQDRKLDEILVLHLVNGKDYFISVSGYLVQTSFGRKITDLVRMADPIRRQNLLVDIEQSPDEVLVDKDSPVALNIPKELWRIVDYLYQNGLFEEELFAVRGSPMDIGAVRDAIDTDGPIRVSSVHSVAESLILFLDSFPEPVIPYEHYPVCLEHCTHFANSKRALRNMDFSHRNVFKYICGFLREILSHSELNRSNAKFLSQVFGDVLLKPQLPETGNVAKSTSKKRSLFVYQFLTNDYDE